MYPYEQAQIDTFLGLINESNPGLVVQLTAADLGTLVPSAITPQAGTIQDSSIRLSVQQSPNYYGNQLITYRRINPNTFFRGMTPVPVNAFSASGTLTPAQFASALNTQYGTAFVATDFTFLSIGPISGNTISIATKSLCYNGSLTYKWVNAKQQLSSLFTTSGNVLTGKLFPGGNTFGGARKPQGEYFFYGLDCTSIASTLAALTSGVAVDFTTGSGATLLAFLQAARPDLSLTSSADSVAGGLQDLVLTKFSLPSAAVPEANSTDFADVATITALSGSWFQGRIFLHHN